MKKPTNVNIACEMVRMAGKGIKDFGFGLGIGIITPLMLLTLPTFTRYAMKSDSKKDTLNVMTHVGMYSGALPSGLASIVGTIYLLGNNPKYLAIPLATNIASGFYEFARKAKKNLEEKIKEEDSR